MLDKRHTKIAAATISACRHLPTSLFLAVFLLGSMATAAPQNTLDKPVTVVGRIQVVLGDGSTIKVKGHPYALTKKTRIGYKGALPHQLPLTTLKHGMRVSFTTRPGSLDPLKEVIILPR